MKPSLATLDCTTRIPKSVTSLPTAFLGKLVIDSMLVTILALVCPELSALGQAPNLSERFSIPGIDHLRTTPPINSLLNLETTVNEEHARYSLQIENSISAWSAISPTSLLGNPGNPGTLSYTIVIRELKKSQELLRGAKTGFDTRLTVQLLVEMIQQETDDSRKRSLANALRETIGLEIKRITRLFDPEEESQFHYGGTGRRFDYSYSMAEKQVAVVQTIQLLQIVDEEFGDTSLDSRPLRDALLYLEGVSPGAPHSRSVVNSPVFPRIDLNLVFLALYRIVDRESNDNPRSWQHLKTLLRYSITARAIPNQDLAELLCSELIAASRVRSTFSHGRTAGDPHGDPINVLPPSGFGGFPSILVNALRITDDEEARIKADYYLSKLAEVTDDQNSRRELIGLLETGSSEYLLMTFAALTSSCVSNESAWALQSDTDLSASITLRKVADSYRKYLAFCEECIEEKDFVAFQVYLASQSDSHIFAVTRLSEIERELEQP